MRRGVELWKRGMFLPQILPNYFHFNKIYFYITFDIKIDT